MEFLIRDFDFKGRGFAKYNEKAVFLDGGVIGDKVLAEIVEDKKKYSIAKISKILEPSPYRVKSKCPYIRKCGGCDFLEYDYEKQLEWKKEKVNNDMLRIGNIECKVENTIGMQYPYYYRNNIQLKVVDGKIGYFSKNSKDLISIKHCLIAGKEINRAIEILKNWKGLNSVDSIIIRENKLGELFIVLVTKSEIKKVNQLLSELLELKICGIFENKNTSNKFRFGREFKKLYGEDYLTDELCGFKFKLSPVSFFQVNTTQTEKLYQEAIDYLEINKQDIIFDLYCGIGTISLFAARNAKTVIGVEIVENAIEDARKNAEFNSVDNVRFICGKSEEILEKLLDEEKIIPNKIILDPPRAGLDEKLIKKLLEIMPEKISYISCNSSTQARDLKLLKEKYKIEKIQPVDMFCNSVHVETIVLLSKLDSKKYISVELPMDDMDLTSAESKATYKQIQNYVFKKFGFKVSNLYIAQVKEKCGIKERENYNKPKKEDLKQPICPIEKEEAIKDAFRYFQMI
ncbi:23S rRNA (uracil(1939)-C(5))-methyltransferase RlmD [Peptoniphilus mikwangii]|uniref:23S rRNA (uracil(1939)-C(5))-methyltransferase RlmD n=1 Tax=Peptoniphilus mikwangii TaxID=1354300 RepID=UPI00040D9FCE|nr:23S rRNA (uracil(1939)-C(5))-methyltransferase RlmD [Peptoniphilus mikwangii]